MTAAGLQDVAAADWEEETAAGLEEMAAAG